MKWRTHLRSFPSLLTLFILCLFLTILFEKKIFCSLNPNNEIISTKETSNWYHSAVEIIQKKEPFKEVAEKIPARLFRSGYIPNEDETDILYLGCDLGTFYNYLFQYPDASRFSKRIAIVRPFVYKNVESLLRNLGYWEMEELLPCKPGKKLPIDLIFWFHRYFREK
jgi:hypothetical protein